MAAMSIFDHEIPDDTHDLYYVTFSDDTIQTLVTDTPSFVDGWIADIERFHHRRLHRLIVGLDVEWRPTFNANFRNPVATLQLCVGRRCLIFQILYSSFIPQSLSNFLCNSSYTFVGIGIESDIEKLCEDYNLRIASIANLRTLVAVEYNARELCNAGLKGLARRVLGKEINKPKGITLSRWDKQWLSPAQVRYAYVDAFLSFEIGRILIYGD